MVLKVLLVWPQLQQCVICLWNFSTFKDYLHLSISKRTDIVLIPYILSSRIEAPAQCSQEISLHLLLTKYVWLSILYMLQEKCFCIICSGFHCIDHPSIQTYFKLMISDCWLCYVQRTLLLCFWSSIRRQSFNSCFLAVQSHGRVWSTGSFKVCILYLCFALWFSFSFLLWFCCTNKKIGRKRLLLFCFIFQFAQLVWLLFAQTNSSFCGFVAQTHGERQTERETERIKHAIAAIPICPWSSNFHVFRMIKWLMLLILHQRYVCTKVLNLSIQTMQALLFLTENASIMEIK